MSLPSAGFHWPQGAPAEEALSREWLVTNGLGGYASGTLAGCNTRRYHGLFVPTLPGLGRVVVLPRLEAQVHCGGRSFRLDGAEFSDGTLHLPGLAALRTFTLTGTLPRWEWSLGGTRLVRELMFLHEENTAFLRWRHLGGAPLQLQLRPFTAFRFHDRPLPQAPVRARHELAADRISLVLAEHVPALRLRWSCPGGASFTPEPLESQELHYRVERARGLDHLERQHSPGLVTCTLREGEQFALGLTLEPWEALDRRADEAFELEAARQARLLAAAPRTLRAGTGARLALAADQFLVRPVTRPQEEAWARAEGRTLRSVIAGYPWFTDWGRDTMISLEGLTLSTGRHAEAAAILRTFQHSVRDGLLPNLFPEGGQEGLYHTADATLWFFHALARYLRATGDVQLLHDAWPTLEDILHHHLRGTRFGIRVDPEDGLLTQGTAELPLTWMDARVDGWVVTPRRGKAVEINALWFNALRHAAAWARQLGRPDAGWDEAAALTRESFDRRFWDPAAQHLRDVVDGESPSTDGALRPNQILAISLDHPVCRPERWQPVLAAVDRALLTPVGLRTLVPGHPDYRATYDGDLTARDAAYHQGTVWPWLLGHYVDAAARAGRPPEALKPLLQELALRMDTGCVGTLGEIFDASPPFRHRGCFAQAWSVAELMRHWQRLG